jgi:HEPN domain
VARSTIPERVPWKRRRNASAGREAIWRSLVLNAKAFTLEDLCFHAQQAAEKAIKGLLIRHRIEFPYVHDLAALLTLLEKTTAEVPECIRAGGWTHAIRGAGAVPRNRSTHPRKGIPGRRQASGRSRPLGAEAGLG